MNKEYLYIDGKCVIYDQNGAILEDDGKIALRQYSDKLDEILIQENMIEALEDELVETEHEIEKRKKLVKSNKNTMWFDVIAFGSMPLAIQYLLRFVLGKEVLMDVMTNGDIVNTILKVLIISLTTIFGGAFLLSNYNSYKYNKKKLDGNESKKEAIEKTLDKEKQKLEELNKTQKSSKLEEEMSSRKVNYLNRLRKLRNDLDAYYGCGYNKQKYERYLKSGKLEKKLSRKYTLEEIKLIKEYLQQKSKENSSQGEEVYTRQLK